MLLESSLDIERSTILVSYFDLSLKTASYADIGFEGFVEFCASRADRLGLQ